MISSTLLLPAARNVYWLRIWRTSLTVAAWSLGSCVTAELLGYWLHRLLHSGWIGFLSHNHMKHHLVLYGPLQNQRSEAYHDATTDSVALGNIGLEWLIPAALLMGTVGIAFHLLRVPLAYQVVSLGSGMGWSFLMFSYLHDVMHIEGFWLEKNGWLRSWFISARQLHDIHHQRVNDDGLMDRNFGIGFYLFDRVFGTLCAREQRFNPTGYQAAIRRFKEIIQ